MFYTGQMPTEILTTWGDYQVAVDRLLAVTSGHLHIYDSDLAQIKLDAPARIEALQRLLMRSREANIRIALRDTTHLHRHQPRLTELWHLHTHCVFALQTPENLAHLRDCMILADARHGLVRFDQDHPRCKLILDDPEELAPYVRRFNEIWQEGGTALTSGVTGL